MATEKRLIDANALGIGRCNPDAFPFENRAYCAGWNGVIGLLEQAPTVDAVEVVHGQWEKQLGIDHCSVCHKVRPYDVQADVVQYWQCDYCPNCGADMKEN